MTLSPTLHQTSAPHTLIARIERAIVVNEHAKYSAHESGNTEREAQLDLELSYLLRSYQSHTGRTFHTQFVYGHHGVEVRA